MLSVVRITTKIPSHTIIIVVLSSSRGDVFSISNTRPLVNSVLSFCPILSHSVPDWHDGHAVSRSCDIAEGRIDVHGLFSPYVGSVCVSAFRGIATKEKRVNYFEKKLHRRKQRDKERETNSPRFSSDDVCDLMRTSFFSPIFTEFITTRWLVFNSIK